VHSVEAGIIRKLIVMPTHTVPIVADITHVIQKTALSGLDRKRSQKVEVERNISFGEAKQIVDRQAVPGVTPAVRTGFSYAKATVSATSQTTQSVEIVASRAAQSVEIQTDLTWLLDCKYPILCSSVFQPLAGGHLKGSAAQTDSADSVFLEASG